MSHNKIKIGSQSPNANGEISAALNDLSDVDVSAATNGTLLKYVSASWKSGLPGFDTDDYALLASNRNTGSVSTVYDAVNDNSLMSDSRNSGYGREETKGSAAVFTHLFQSGTTFSGGNNLRYSGFTLPANSKFLLIAVHTGIFNSAAGQSILQWMDENDNPLGNQIQVQRDDRGPKKIIGHIEVGGTAVKVFPTVINTNNHRRMNYSDGDSWQAIRIG